MEAAFVAGVEVRTVDSQKGKGLFATKTYSEGDVIFEETPFVSCQFAWNKVYKYAACDFCMRPLETAEENVRRLAARSDIVLPYRECCDTLVGNIRDCLGCDAKYCSDNCRDIAYHLYHRTLCHNSADVAHPLVQLMETWRQVHFPPETANIMLLLRILAIVHQASDPESVCRTLKEFCHRTVNEDSELVHKLLGAQFADQLGTLREMTATVISSPAVNQFLTPDGFCSLMALIGTNGQGIGTSPLAQWVNKVSTLVLPSMEKNKLDTLIDSLYDDIEKESGSFLNAEGSGLYKLQSTCNHSCIPNAEATFPYSTHRLQLKALCNIDIGDEILISYLDECSLSRSRHSRQKELSSNYLFNCACEKCINQKSEPDFTSAEEMSEDEVEDMSD